MATYFLLGESDIAKYGFQNITDKLEATCSDEIIIKIDGAIPAALDDLTPYTEAQVQALYDDSSSKWYRG